MLSGQLREAGCWRTVAEVARRCPGRLRLIETHGQAFLDLRWRGEAVNSGTIRIQRTGDLFCEPFHVGFPHQQDWPGYLTQLAAAEDPYEPIMHLCKRTNLPYGHKLPASTPEVVVFRTIAAFMAAATFGRDRWRCHNGYWDSSDGGYLQQRYFDAVCPGVLADISTTRSKGYPDHPGYDWWFLLDGGQPKVAVDITGEMYDSEGEYWNLPDLYRQHQRIWPVLNTTLGHLLP